MKSNTLKESYYYCLYIGDLNLKVKENDLIEIFYKHYKSFKLRICKDIFSGNSLGYSYIYFNSIDSAKKALLELNFYSDTKLFKTPIRIMWKNVNNNIRKSGYGNLFVKNLPLNFSSKDLHALFSEYGEILSLKIRYDEDGNSLGYGFVHYNEMNNAMSAIKNLNGKMIYNRIITVTHFISKSEREKMLRDEFFTNIFVKNLPIEKLCEKVILNLFEVFGKITSIFIPLLDNGLPKGFAYINFENQQDAEEAIFTMNNRKIAGNSIVVCKAENRFKKEKLRKNDKDSKIKYFLPNNNFENGYQDKKPNITVERFSNNQTHNYLKILSFSSKLTIHLYYKDVLLNLFYISIRKYCSAKVEKILNLFLTLKFDDILKILFTKKGKKKRIFINFKKISFRH